MNNQDIIDLLNRYDREQCTEQEKIWVETWYLDHTEEPLAYSIEELTDDLDEIAQRLNEHIRFRRIAIWPRIAAAASILVVLSVGGYFMLHKQTHPQLAQNHILNDVPPGGNNAVLTLSNGKQISLTSARYGTISKEGNHIIKKTGGGSISYESDDSSTEEKKLTYNTITTPRGGQWSVILPDGTKVILDAASSIKYPLSFGTERLVQITGQAYFEVVHNPIKPFRIIAKGQVIEDIGTKFNVNAYDDEPATNTTLLEGAVKVSNPNGTSFSDRNGIALVPGQQAVSQNNKLTLSNANIEKAFAWKNGYFQFDDERIEGIMRELSRWYNIQVDYKGNLPPSVVFDGEIPRNTSLTKVLKVLEAAKVHFTVVGNKLTVTP